MEAFCVGTCVAEEGIHVCADFAHGVTGGGVESGGGHGLIHDEGVVEIEEYGPDRHRCL